MNQPRYSDPFDYTNQPVVLCQDCSTRTRPVAIPADEIAEHDAWHEQPPVNDLRSLLPDW